MSLTTCPYPFSPAWTLRTPNFTLALDDGLDTPGSHELHAASHSVANRAEPLLTNHPTEPPWPTSGQWVDSRLASNSPSLVAKPQGTGSTVSGSNTELPPPLSAIMPLLSQIIAPMQLISRRSSWMDWAGCIVAVMIITVMSIMPDGSAGIFFSCPKLVVRSWLFSWPPDLARHPALSSIGLSSLYAWHAGAAEDASATPKKPDLWPFDTLPTCLPVSLSTSMVASLQCRIACFSAVWINSCRGW